MKLPQNIYNMLPIIVVSILGLTPVLWFIGKGNALINGLDTNFPLDPLIWFQRRLFIWNSTSNAGSDFSSGVAGLFFHLVQVIPYFITHNLQLTEVISFIFWFSIIVFSAYIFARTVVSQNKIAQIIFVIIYSFNIYLFNTWENIKVSNISLVASLPLFLSIIHAYKTNLITVGKLVFFSALVSVISSGAGINPAYFISIIIGMIIYTIITSASSRNKQIFKKVWSGFGLSLLVLVLTNSFWILPLFNNIFISKQVTSLSDIGFADWLGSLSKNTSLFNVLRLQGAWDWYVFDPTGIMPLYIPYAFNYFSRLPFIIFSFVLPVLAFTSLILLNKKVKEIYLVFATFLALGVFLGAGSHEPTGGVYHLLVKYIPFFSFFRSPWYIFTPFLVTAFAGLASLLYENLNIRFKGSKIVLIGALVFISGHLIFSYPLITGKIFRPGRTDSFYVNFPSYVWETKDWLNRENYQNRIISYPDDQLEKFNWGYQGTESILNLFSDREVITPSFSFPNKGLQNLLDEFHLLLKRGQYDSAISMLPYFGADTIFNRKDMTSFAPNLNEQDNIITSKMSSTSFGNWSFLKLRSNEGISKISIPERIYVNTARSVLSVSLLLPSSAVVNSQDSEVKKIDQQYKHLLVASEAVNKNSPNNLDTSVQPYNVIVSKDGSYNLLIERYGITFSTGKGSKDLGVKLDSGIIDKALFKEDDKFLIVGPLNIKKGEHIVEIVLPQVINLMNVDSSKQLKGVNELRDLDLTKELSRTLVVYNSTGEIQTIHLPLDNFDPFSNYRFSFEYKYFYGSVPNIEGVQFNQSSILRTFPKNVGSSFDWQKESMLITPVPTNSKLDLFVVMPPNAYGGKSKTYMENFALKRVFNNKVFLVEEEGSIQPATIFKPSISWTKKSPVEYHVEVSNINEPYVLAFLENYNPNWQIISDSNQIDIPHFTINGYANGWYLPVSNSAQKFKLYYKPQDYNRIGFIITILTLLCSIFIFFNYQIKYRKRINP
ncbi:MAG: alpha-(1-_3)-arabinofuranosyltransferase family protein [Candidatus Daviesbacteria bacterium]|nr:alpha-(1->3)-arabinofuranosyltransferase family protein [Candidatus Daviesbacteria bacterium]